MRIHKYKASSALLLLLISLNLALFVVRIIGFKFMTAERAGIMRLEPGYNTLFVV